MKQTPDSERPKSGAIGERIMPKGPGTRRDRFTQARTGRDPELHLVIEGRMPARRGQGSAENRGRP